MGVLPLITPQIAFTEPANGDTLAVGQDFDVAVQTSGFQGGLFDDPQTQYGQRPFSINPETGNAIGHSHVYVQQLNGGVTDAALDSFLALNDPDNGGALAGTVPAVAEPGLYRLCTDISGGNHLSFPKGVAQEGGQSDCIQVEFVDEGAGDEDAGDEGDEDAGDEGDEDAGDEDGEG
jgi:hypothetical protein